MSQHLIFSNQFSPILSLDQKSNVPRLIGVNNISEMMKNLLMLILKKVTDLLKGILTKKGPPNVCLLEIIQC